MKPKTTKNTQKARSRAATGSAAGLAFDAIMKRADALYAAEKTKHVPKETLMYWAPEMFPRIQSEQVKCMLRALLEALEKQPNAPLQRRADGNHSTTEPMP